MRRLQFPLGEPSTIAAVLNVGSSADSVIVTAPRLQGDAEAINIERMSSEIVQVEPQGVIQSLPNTNVADAIGRLPSVSLERDEGEGKYVQIRGTEPRLNNLTINGVNIPSVEVSVRNVKMDAIPANGIERIEVYKTLAADQDADGIGGTVNLVTPMPQDKPTYALGRARPGTTPCKMAFGAVASMEASAIVGAPTRSSAFCSVAHGAAPTAASMTLSRTDGRHGADGTNVAYISSEDFVLTTTIAPATVSISVRTTNQSHDDRVRAGDLL